MRDWRDRSLCWQMDYELMDKIFFPPGTQAENAQAARSLCARCPVQDECRTFAGNHNPRDGIWGGDDYRRDRNGKRCTSEQSAPQASRSTASARADTSPSTS